MKFTLLTLFPDIVKPFFDNSIMAKALEKGLVEYEIIDFRKWSADKHRSCDDYQYGGGPGMVLRPEPVGSALDSIGIEGKRVVYPTPSGTPFTQDYAHALAGETELVIVCGRYEGLDQRIIDAYVDDEVCIGDYVMSSGELAGLVIVDTVYRLLEGVINTESLVEESFIGNLLEYPVYTRPEIYNTIGVPEVLLSGHHEKIKRWRRYKQLEKTFKVRPDLLKKAIVSESDKEFLIQIEQKENDDEPGTSN